MELAATLRDDFGGAMTVELRDTELWSEVFGHPVRLGFPIYLLIHVTSLLLLGPWPV